MDAAPRSAATSLPAPPPAAGEELFVSLALVNTRFQLPSGPYEGLPDPSAVEVWLTRRALLPAGIRLDMRQTTRLHDLREALRVLCEACISGVTPDLQAVEHVNAALTACPPTRMLTWAAEGPHRVLRPHPEDPLDLALAVLAENGTDLLTGTDAAKIAACGTPGCTRLMIRSHAARRWCSNRCGNRIRAARHAGTRSRPRTT